MNRAFMVPKDPPASPGRREFIRSASAAAALTLAAGSGKTLFSAPAEEVVLPPLGYPENGLEPYISARTVGFHYGKHHRAYIETTRDLIRNTRFAGMNLQAIVKLSAPKDPSIERSLWDPNYSIYKNSVLALNHNLYWKSLKPRGGGPPPIQLEAIMAETFGSYKTFRLKFLETASLGVHGWAWIVREEAGRIGIERTEYGDNPLFQRKKPLACIDLWEHAFYLDYQDRFLEYLEACVDRLFDWQSVLTRFNEP